MQLALTKLIVATSLLLVAAANKLVFAVQDLSDITQEATAENYTLQWVAYDGDGEAFNHTGEIQYTGEVSGLAFYIGDIRPWAPYYGDGCITSSDAPVGEVKVKAEYCEQEYGLKTVVIRRSDGAIVGAANCCNSQARLTTVSGSGTIMTQGTTLTTTVFFFTGDNQVHKCGSDGGDSCTVIVGRADKSFGAGNQELYMPTSAVVADAYVIVNDKGNNRIQKCPSQIQGNCTQLFTTSGAALTGGDGIALDGNGNLVFQKEAPGYIYKCPTIGANDTCTTKIDVSSPVGGIGTSEWQDILVLPDGDYALSVPWGDTQGAWKCSSTQDNNCSVIHSGAAARGMAMHPDGDLVITDGFKLHKCGMPPSGTCSTVVDVSETGQTGGKNFLAVAVHPDGNYLLGVFGEVMKCSPSGLCSIWASISWARYTMSR